MKDFTRYQPDNDDATYTHVICWLCDGSGTDGRYQCKCGGLGYDPNSTRQCRSCCADEGQPHAHDCEIHLRCPFCCGSVFTRIDGATVYKCDECPWGFNEPLDVRGREAA